MHPDKKAQLLILISSPIIISINYIYLEIMQLKTIMTVTKTIIHINIQLMEVMTLVIITQLKITMTIATIIMDHLINRPTIKPRTIRSVNRTFQEV